jgi:hypothetical protein
MKPENRHIVITVMVLLLSVNICFGFDDEGFQYWNTLEANFDLNKDWKIEFEQDMRLGDDGGNLYYNSSDLGFVYKSLADRVDIGFGYKQISEKDNDNVWQPEYRPHFSATLKDEIFGLDFSNRSRFEYRNRESSQDLWRYRNRLSVELPYKFTVLKMRPYITDEVFFNLDEQGYNRNRLNAGVILDLSKNTKAKIYYLWQTTRSSGDWQKIHAIGASLILNF